MVGNRTRQSQTNDEVMKSTEMSAPNTSDGVLAIYTEDQRAKMVKKEYLKMRRLFSDLPLDRKRMLDGLLQDAAFMHATLDETRMMIRRDGVTERYQNGAAQFGIKKSSAVEVYDRMLNSYAKVMKQLSDELPVEAKKDAVEEIMKFALNKK